MKKLGWVLCLVTGISIVSWGGNAFAVTTDSIAQSSSNVSTDTTISAPVSFKEEDQKVYGTVPWIWDSGTRTITFSGGEFPASNKESNIRTVIEGDPILEGKKISKIIFTEPITMNENSSYLFSNLKYLETVEQTSLLNMSKVKNASHMFAYEGHFSPYLKQLDVSTWDTSNMTNMSYLFSGQDILQQLDVSKWDTSNVTDMSYLFCYLPNLKNLDVSEWDTSNVTDMSWLFPNNNLENLDVSEWDTSNVTNMKCLFNSLIGMKTIDLSKWDTSNVTDMYGLFGNSGFESLDVSTWDTSNVENFSNMFSYMKNLISLDVSNFDFSSVSPYDELYDMFFNSTSLKNLNISNWDVSEFYSFSHLFYGCSSLESIDLSSWDMRKSDSEYKVYEMFTEAASLNTIILGENNRFYSNADLPEKTEAPYTGAWVLQSGDTKYSSSEEFMTDYDGSKPGTYVREKLVGVTGIQVLPTEISLPTGAEKQLQTKVLPENATNQTVTYVSGNEAVAKVSDNGTVIGVSEGTATITATTEDGQFQGSSAVTVTPQPQSRIALNDFYLGIDEYVTGEVPTDLGAKKAQLLINGTIVSSINITSTGSIELETNGLILTEKDQVEVQVLDRKKVVLDQVTVNIVRKNYTLAANPFILYSGTNLTGQADGFHTEVSLVVNDEEVARTFLSPTYEFSFDPTDFIEYEDDEVELVGYRYGTEITRIAVPIHLPNIGVTIPPYKIGTGYVTGTVTGDSAKTVRLYINNRRQVEDILSADGTFKLTGLLIMSPLDKVEIGIYNESGIELKRVPVSVIY